MNKWAYAGQNQLSSRPLSSLSDELVFDLGEETVFALYHSQFPCSLNPQPCKVLCIEAVRAPEVVCPTKMGASTLEGTANKSRSGASDLISVIAILSNSHCEAPTEGSGSSEASY